MPLPCGVLYAFLLFVQVFSPPAASPNLWRSLTFLRDEVSAVQALCQPLGLFFFALFLALQYIFSFLFAASFVHFSQFLFGFSFWFLLCFRYAAPCFGVYIMEKPAAGTAGRGDCGGGEICVVRRKPPGFH